MNGVIPSLPRMPYGICTDNFAFILYVNGNSSIGQVLLFVAIAWYSDGVLYLVHRTKHPQIFAFHPLKLKLVLLYFYCYGLIECHKEVFIKV